MLKGEFVDVLPAGQVFVAFLAIEGESCLLGGVWYSCEPSVPHRSFNLKDIVREIIFEDGTAPHGHHYQKTVNCSLRRRSTW